MSNVDDLVTDIASIVTSVRPREVMTLKRIEEDYRSIYGHPIPFYKYGFSSLTDLLENHPNHFIFSMADGMLIIRTNVKNNITALIATEKNLKKPKNFQNHAGFGVPLFKKHKRRDMIIVAELPSVILQGITAVVENGLHKSQLLTKFKEHVGYACKFLDYGFADENDVLRYLNSRVLTVRGDYVYRLTAAPEPSLFELLASIVVTKTGYTISCLQEELLRATSTRVCVLMKSVGHVNFVDVVYDASVRGLLSYDGDLVYGTCESRESDVSHVTALYPRGRNAASRVRICHVTSPSQFLLEIVDDSDSGQSRAQLHDKMQRLAPLQPLLSLFRDTRLCSFEYDGEWYRARITDLSITAGHSNGGGGGEAAATVTLHLLDYGLEVAPRAVTVCLPTDRLRYIPRDCVVSVVPGYVHRASLAYVCPLDGAGGSGRLMWSREACDTFLAMVNDRDTHCYSYLVEDDSSNNGADHVSVDLVTCTTTDTHTRHKLVLFQQLVSLGMAQCTLHSL